MRALELINSLNIDSNKLYSLRTRGLIKSTNIADPDAPKPRYDYDEASIRSHIALTGMPATYAYACVSDPRDIKNMKSLLGTLSDYKQKRQIFYQDIVTDCTDEGDIVLRPGLRRVLDMLFQGRICRLVVANPMQLNISIIETFRYLCEQTKCELVIVRPYDARADAGTTFDPSLVPEEFKNAIRG